ncbi:hypothetical protein [Leadbettera azotonutricia]|uniref:Putative lipoprotein n=1 Tax=Leadbettera azotonutricia (strain ATCC BAA-888 / DSM 13862 / ZAS-9) TaxID=545695 RepID=F5Y7R6_LEAAZ|nr:hypothetical protein [Leadbettera azotonutricia]AEF83096.1 putative lipoprotein [Leadbettera azotonutricia ZAS-9]
MQKRFSFAMIAALVAIAGFMLSGCDMEASSLENFEYYLQGSWVSTRDLSSYWPPEDQGRLVIGSGSIKIIGYVLPFNFGYTKDTELIGYSEESSSDSNVKRGTIFIREKGTLKNVPYVRWPTASKEYMLTVGTDRNEETFRKE